MIKIIRPVEKFHDNVEKLKNTKSRSKNMKQNKLVL